MFLGEFAFIVSETRGDILLIYLYDESGSPIGMQYRETSYAADAE